MALREFSRLPTMDLSASMAVPIGQPPISSPSGTASTGGMSRARTSQAANATRLNVTKAALRDFVERRRDDRIGLVVFSNYAYLVSPLTFDYDNLLYYVDEIDDTLLRAEGMTAIGEGIHLANVLLARQSEAQVKNKVIVVFTDGEHNFDGRHAVLNLGLAVHVHAPAM